MIFEAQQVDHILSEALSAGYFEADTDGNLPRDPADRHKAAVELIRQCKLSHDAGVRTDGVVNLLFIAGEQKQPETKGGDSMSAADDLTKQPDAMLLKLEEALGNYEQSEEVVENLNLIRAEMEKRGLASEAPATNGNAEPEMVVQKEVLGPPQVDSFLSDSDVDRAALEDRLTFKIMRAHGIDPSEVAGLSDETLAWIVEHPEPNGGEAVEPVIPPPSDAIQTTKMVVNRDKPAPAAPAAAPPPAPETEDTGASAMSPERTELEEQVTGPMLKAYGRGRKDIPEIGDNELRFMVEHPDARVPPNDLLAARLLDDGVGSAAPEAEPVVPTIAELARAQKAEAPDAFAPPAEDPTPDPTPDHTPDPVQGTTQVVTMTTTPVTPATANKPLLKDLPANPAQEIIDTENFPTPPEIDEKPPRLPFDLSKCSDEEIQSFHAQFHACSSRANYVVGLWESELRDVVKLRKGREVEAYNSLPAKDGRTKLTNEQRDSMVQADAEVVGYRNQEHEVEKILRQLKVLQSNYSSDVAVCSRQMNMRHKESDGAGIPRSS